MRWIWLAGVLAFTACASSSEEPGPSSTVPGTTTTFAATTTSPPASPVVEFPPAPEHPQGALDPEAVASVDRLLENLFTTDWEVNHVNELVDSGDPRTAWVIADLLRFYQGGPQRDELVGAFTNLTGASYRPGEVDFVWAMDHLLAWDLPAWDGYRLAKRMIYGLVDSRWQKFFIEDHHVDWRLVTWGGVLADDRALGDNGPCNCIPGLDYPETTGAAGGDWYPDDRIVFGVVVNGEAIALPKHQMEVHEMVNLTLGGRELGIPYCTLCASAQAYYVDDVPGVDRVVLRTSGLLSRSNKMMYDLTTGSLIDTFTGQATTGPLAEQGVVLEQVSVVGSTWEDWKRAHPDTRIISEDAGLGRRYDFDPLGGRDDFGPIFPVGEVDPRLPVQELVVGVIAPDGTPVAFPINAVRSALADGPIEFQGVEVRLEDAIRVYDAAGEELVSHQAFWFAWSQFHPDTLVWTGLGS